MSPIGRWITRVGVALIALLGAAVMAPTIVDVLRSRSIVERLSEPRRVARIDPGGLRLDDGRFVAWNLGIDVPPTLPILHAATDRGVELDADGNVVGLLEL